MRFKWFVIVSILILILAACTTDPTRGRGEEQDGEENAVVDETDSNDVFLETLESVQEQLQQFETEQAALNAVIESKDNQIIDLENYTQLLEEDLEAAQLALENNGLIEPLSTGPTQNASLIQTAIETLTVIANEDGEGLNAYTSPSAGLRFSSQPFVDVNVDLVFQQGPILENLFQDTTLYLWGYADGTGDPIETTFSDYYDQYVYDEDFLNCDIIGINSVIATGNAYNNISQVYPGASFVEFHFPEFDPQFMGLDWRSLTLVFEQTNGTWYLVGIVHGHWTT